MQINDNPQISSNPLDPAQAAEARPMDGVGKGHYGRSERSGKDAGQVELSG